MPFRPEKAQSKGIDVQQVITSLATHLLEERRKLRDNPRMGDGNASETLTVIQKNGATRIEWETLGTLPHEIPQITVFASSREAVANRESVTSLLERRYKREYALALVRAGEFPDTLEGSRQAMGRAIRARVFVADAGLKL